MKKLLVSLLTLVLTGLPFAQTSINVGTTAATQVKRHKASKTTVHWNDTVDLTWRHSDGTVFAHQKVHNLVTNAGFDLISSAVSNTAAQPAACNYVAVTNTAITPAAGDTTLSGEIVANGLQRAQGTYAHSNGTQTYTVQKVFTATGTQASQATGLFNASGSGTMCYEATYTQVTVNGGDTLTVTWTVTLS